MESIFMVTEYYTPIKHNGCTPTENKTAFSYLSKAVEYVRGVDGNGKPLKQAVSIWLKQDCKPLYDIDYFAGEGIAFKVREECLADAALRQGGYVTMVVIEKLKVY